MNRSTHINVQDIRSWKQCCIFIGLSQSDELSDRVEQNFNFYFVPRSHLLDKYNHFVPSYFKKTLFRIIGNL